MRYIYFMFSVLLMIFVFGCAHSNQTMTSRNLSSKHIQTTDTSIALNKATDALFKSGVLNAKEKLYVKLETNNYTKENIDTDFLTKEVKDKISTFNPKVLVTDENDNSNAKYLIKTDLIHAKLDNTQDKEYFLQLNLVDLKTDLIVYKSIQKID